jgi:hypothetical protein
MTDKLRRFTIPITQTDWFLVLEKLLLDKFSGTYKLWIEDGKVIAYQQIPATVNVKEK